MSIMSLKRALALLVPLLCVTPTQAATDVILMYGWGPNGWSSGIDTIARRARTLSGVNRVSTMDYRFTQRAYDQIVAAHHNDPHRSFVIGGYSCGGNGAIAVAAALRNNSIRTHVITLQPSVWCGRYALTDNVALYQSTWSPGTLGLGSYQPEGPPAHYSVFVQRDYPHGAADTDPMYQRDALYAIAAVADPARRPAWERHLIRTAPHVDRQDAQVIWRRE
jgi:hypothetical protein